MKHALIVALAAAACACTLPAAAHDYTLAALSIDRPYARATPPGADIGGAYMTIGNSGPADDTLIGASTPVAGSVQIHTMSMDGNVMRMREVANLDIPPGKEVALTPDGYHLMLVGLKKPLVEGTRVPLTLRFAHAGAIDVEAAVQSMSAGAAGMH
ncbi:MAG: copper chaperone PCu(A)C [Casimicrobiaceae bacterium]